MPCARRSGECARLDAAVIEQRHVVATHMERKRRDHELSLAMLAALSNCSRSYINAVKHGAVGIGLDRLDSIARALECPPAELLENVEHLPPVCAPPTSPDRDVPLRRVLASNLRRWARHRKLTSVERLAHVAGMSVRQVYAMLRGGVSSSIDHLVPLATGLAVLPHVLIDLDPTAPLPR